MAPGAHAGGVAPQYPMCMPSFTSASSFYGSLHCVSLIAVAAATGLERILMKCGRSEWL